MGQTYSIRFLPVVDAQDLAKIDTPIKKRILETIWKKLLVSPELFSKPLSQTLHPWRTLRVGDYRVVFEVIKDEIVVLLIAVGHRSKVYELAEKRK